METFIRKEMKYMITDQQKQQLLECLQSKIEPDIYFDCTIYSIYFDTKQLDLLRHCEGKPGLKQKARLRSYQPAYDATTSVFLELKKKAAGTSFKTRHEFTLPDLKEFLLSGQAVDQATRELSSMLSRYELLAQNGNQIISEDEQKTAALLCGAAIEARVLGLPQPAMSVTGSGAHGIIATMPLFAAAKVSGYDDETLLRATALSDLICMYIKEYSGKLSAFCGCAIAAGTDMACGLVLLHGGGLIQMKQTINNMASSITGMICDGGNQGCTMKGVMAVDAAWRAAKMALQGIYVFDVHGINGTTPEKTMYNMGKIASPGMIGTEKTIMDILNQKQKEKESRNA